MSKQKWTVDPAHSEIRFKVKHMMITNVSGCFNTFEVNMQCNEGFDNLEVQFHAETASVNTLNPQRDQHIRSADFFNSEAFPVMKFDSTSFTKMSEQTYLLKGDLTIKGVTQPIELQANYLGTAVDMYGNKKAGFEISGSLNRTHYALSWHATTDDGVIVLDDVVKLMIQVQMVLQNN